MESLRTVRLNGFESDNGVLRVIEQSAIPFHIVRLFYIEAPTGATRGRHAHVVGQQFFIAVSGCIKVCVEDCNRVQRTVVLNPGEGLFVPPLHWATEHFERDGSVLLVLCDSAYDEADYIRDYSEFVSRSVTSL